MSWPLSLQDPIPEASLLKADGTLIYVVGVTNATREDQLRDISSPPQEEGVTWWNAPDFTALDSFLQTLLKTTCTETCEPQKITGKLIYNYVWWQ